MAYAFRLPTEVDAREVLGWRYAAPYELYNAESVNLERDSANLLDPANRYFVSIDGAGAVIGFCCYGADAQVAGGDYRDIDLLDVGLGLRPDLTGHGRGAAFFAAVLAFGREHLGARRYRLTVAAFNQRATRVYERAGFRAVARFRRDATPGGPEFVLMREM